MSVAQKFGMFLIPLLIVTAPLAAESRTLTQNNKIILSGSKAMKNGFLGRWLTLIYEEAFNRLGYDLEYVGFPAKRASILSNAGKTDGEIARISSYGESQPNLIQVKEPSFSIRVSAYSKRKGLVLNGWQSLKGKDINVDYLRGIKQIESKLHQYVKSARITQVNNNVVGLKRLLLKRSDVFIGGERNIDEILNTDKSFQQKEVYKAGVIEEVFLHAWLHNKNAALAPRLSRVLQEMKAEGLVAKFKIQAK